MAALLSAGAAAIHASVAGPHFQEYVPFGVLFVITALAQALWAALILLMPSRRLLAAGVAGNASIVISWALSRTTGLPFGPEAWTAEPATPLDVAATAFELGIVAAGGLLLAARGPYPKASAGKVTRVAAIGAIAVAGLTCAAFAGAEGGTAGHHRPGPAEHAVPEPNGESTRRDTGRCSPTRWRDPRGRASVGSTNGAAREGGEGPDHCAPGNKRRPA